MDSDRISSLPNDMMVEILSFLPSVTAVRSSILSKAWKDIWKLSTAMHILDQEPYNSDERLLLLREKLMGSMESRLLEHFRLQFSMPHPVAYWIDDSISRWIRELDLEVPELHLPASFLACGTLTKLKLRMGQFLVEDFEQGTTISLPKLTFFDSSAHYSVARNVIRIIEHSPALKSVNLFRCCYLPYIAPMTKHLHLQKLEFLDVTVRGKKTLFHVLDYCPALEYLSFGRLEECYRERNIPRCLIDGLKTLEVKYIRSSDGPELSFLEEVIANSKRLRKVKVCCGHYMPPPMLLLVQRRLQELACGKRQFEILFDGKEGWEVIK